MVKDLQLILTIVFIQIDTHTPTHACTLNFMPVGHSCNGGNYDKIFKIKMFGQKCTKFHYAKKKRNRRLSKKA